MKPGMIFFILFISIFYIVGFGLLGKGLRDYSKGRKALSWPIIQATITDCRLNADADSDGTTWKVNVQYKYSVNGNYYVGDQIAFGYCGSGSHDMHKAIYEKLLSSKQMYVKYDPENPMNSVVAAGFNRSTFLTLAFAITWLLFIFGFTVLWIGASGQDYQILNQINMITEY